MKPDLPYLKFHLRSILGFTILLGVMIACVNTSPQNPNTSGVAYKPSPISLPRIPAFVTSVSNFAAVPNDGKDDTTAIQAGLDAVNAAGGGTLEFPAGRYDISIDPAKNRALTLYPRLRLAGKAGETAIIRLADNQITYESIMATATYPTRLDDAEFLNLTFDGNGLNNPIRKPEETNGDLGTPTLRYVIRSFAGERVRIQNCTFTNIDNGNTVSFNGEAVTDVAIEDSRFLAVGGALIDHDHSSIYTDGKRFRIVNNEFKGRNGAGTIGARTAIETHGDDIEVSGNTISGYMQGANIVGRATDPSRQLFKDNSFSAVAVGLKLWPLGDAGPKDPRPAFTNLSLVGNTIDVSADAWWATKAMVTDAPAGISFEADISDGRVAQLDVSDNRINFASFAGKTGNEDRISVGIGLRGIEGKLLIDQVSVSQNQISNTIGPCILSTANLGSSELSQIEGNTLTDCGRGPNLIGAGDVLRSGIVIAGTTRNLTLSKNTITTRTVPASTLNGLVIASSCLGGCVVNANQTSGLKQGLLNTGNGWTITGPSQ
jgi:hypothetical protein